ncbi:discoidin domain-containing protein [Paenibacillus sp. GCM10023248]|uniref:discoidin domain-containing protein n=1 Tax=unclassified Paenibacillus TaxID=185978 RepID=UPI002377EDC4|nr:discoidin domain-containing protein [Paenibacillus sp. MAHUQ-63]MDD9268802.1 discoidin domain-containing protein [Paenibacillus sp. MAHUQ-63]
MTHYVKQSTDRPNASKNRFPHLLALTALAAAFVLPAPAGAATVNCSTAACLTTALANASPGDHIVLAAGTYTGNFVSGTNGNSANPIIIESASAANKAILNGGGTSSGYTLYLTGDYTQVKNLKITNAKKGIMIDNSNNGLIDGVEVYNIGEEGVHYRDGSSNNVIQNSTVYDTGKVTADYGEGVYVGSDVGKWGTYVKEANNNRITNVTIGPNVTAESVDIKEGTTGTIVENSTFNGTGISGANAADSFMDVKGNNSIIRNNTAFRNSNSIIVDAFQVHERSPGWGYNNDFYNNTVNLDTAAPYVVLVNGGSATACNNTRTPAGNMYTSGVTTYTSCSDGTPTPNILSVSAVSDSGNDGNVASNTLDNNLSTRWSSQGDGQWIKYDLGTSKTVKYASIAFHQGDVRTTTFDVQISTDNTNWTTVLASKVSALTLSQVDYDFADMSARYVRVVGHGNSSGNGWNSITEVDIYGN